MCMVKNGCGQSGHSTLKLAVSQEWIDGRNWFFSCWCKFRKAKSFFNDSWVGLVKNAWSFSSWDPKIWWMSVWIELIFFFFNWDSPHARLNSHYEAWSCKKKSTKKDYRIQKICLERTYSYFSLPFCISS